MIYTKEFDDGNILNIDPIDKSNWAYNCDTKESSQPKVNLFYNYYKDESADRQMEIDYCLIKLIHNPHIDNIYVLCSDVLSIDNEKLVKINFNGFPKFKDFFNIIDFVSNDNDINMIINSDCYINEDDMKTMKNEMFFDEAYLLSRWEILKLNPLKIEHFDVFHKDDTGCSQDAWVFVGKPKDGLVGDFHFGKAGCDNAIAFEFRNAGYNTYNPSKTIKIYHYHLTEKRTYGDYTEREEHRIQKPYLFIPSKTLYDIKNSKKICFYNHQHNGDIHYSREFIKDIMKKYKSSEFCYYMSLNDKSWNPSNVISDINIEAIDISNLPDGCDSSLDIFVNGNSIYINTWVGQLNQKYVKEIGINLLANYEIYKKIYEKLKIKIEDMEYYIPEINYSKFKIDGINDFIKKYKNKFKVLLSNGQFFSGQGIEFNFDEVIQSLSFRYNDVIFITTNPTDVKANNIFSASEIIGKDKNLNEISYLSTFCDIIIGRSSGAYVFCHTKENLFNPKKTFMTFVLKESTEWYISDKCDHIVSDSFNTSEISKIIFNEIDKKKKKKLRIAFSIILNGLEHLKHNDYGNKIPDMVDYWVIVEGATKSNGSTSWCKEILDEYHKNGKSIDGTVDYIKKLKKSHKNIIFVESGGLWDSKDVMVNRAIEEVKKLTDSCFLWEIDIDEQWNEGQLIKSEKELLDKKGKTGEFNIYQFVGENLIAIGSDWPGNPFIRLWDWDGDNFTTHEPPVLGGNKNKILLSEKMKHYSFYFSKDVKFKDNWYTHHDGSYEQWLKLKDEKTFPINISYLFPNFSKRYGTNNIDGWIVEYDKYLKNEYIIKKPEIKPTPTVPVPQPPVQQPIQRSSRETCEEYMRTRQNFIINYNGRVIFDSTMSDKSNLSFMDDGFILYGKMFSYRGMIIMRK